jgi:hypothetical protein
MPLIKDFQQENSGVPKPPTTVKIPKPAVAPPAAPESTLARGTDVAAFEQGNPAELQIAPDASALPESVAAPETQPQPGLNLTQYLGNTTPLPLPAFDAPVVPQGTSLWKDTQINLGVPNLYDPKIVTTQEPTLYRNPLSTGSAAVDQANSNLRSTVQRTNASLDEQARNAQASQASLQNATRSALPNTPDATKPWYGQITDGLSRWAFGSPAAEAAAKRGEVNVSTGSYGANGAGAGGLFNTISNFAIGLPLAVQSTINRTTVEGIHQAAKLNNPPLRQPILRKDPFSGKEIYVKLRYNDLSEKEQREYVARGYNQSIAWTGFNQPITDLTGETNYAGDLLRLQRTARVAEPNPELSGKRTTGAFYDVGKTKEGFFERPQTAIPEIVYNLLTPGNKIDIAGEVVGRAIGFVAKPLVKKVAPIFRRAAGTKPVQAEIVTPPPSRAVPSSAIEVSRAVRTTNTPEAPFTPPTASSGTPVTPNYNQGVILKLDPSQQLPSSKPIIPAYKGASVRPSSAEEQLGKIVTPPGQSYTYEVDPSLAVSAPISRPTNPVAVTREGKPILALPPAVANIPDYKPTLTQVFPKTDAVGLAAEVGIGTPGRIIEFTPETSTRSLEDVIAHLRKTPEGREILQDYTGKTWEEFREHIAKNHSDIDVGQFGSIGTKVEEINPAPPKLSDLTEQSTELAEQRALVEQPIQQLEQLFDEAVDLGRRTDDRLPLTKLTAEDFYRAIDNGAKPPLVDEALSVFERDIAEALRTNNTDALSRVRFEYQQQQIAKALELHNAALEPRPLLTAESKFPRYISPDAPRVVFHGTALARFTPDYNVETFGSRGELGSGLYTTTNKEEAVSYARAVVGENRSAEIAYEPIKPQVVELETSAFKAPLNARAIIQSNSDEAKAVINSFSSVEDKRAVARSILVSGKKTYADYVAIAERQLAQTNASEQALQTYNKRLSKRLRGLGYDAIHDPNSGWFVAIDNAKLKQVVAEPVEEATSAVEPAIARYNADSLAAASYPDHLTSDANLRDSAYKVLDQARADIDEKLAEVQQQAQAEIANSVQEPVVKVADDVRLPEGTYDPVLVAKAKEELRAEGFSTDQLFLRYDGYENGAEVYRPTVNGHVAQAGKELYAETKLQQFEMIPAIVSSRVKDGSKQFYLVDANDIDLKPKPTPAQIEVKAVEVQAVAVYDAGKTADLSSLEKQIVKTDDEVLAEITQDIVDLKIKYKTLDPTTDEAIDLATEIGESEIVLREFSEKMNQPPNLRFASFSNYDGVFGQGKIEAIEPKVPEVFESGKTEALTELITKNYQNYDVEIVLYSDTNVVFEATPYHLPNSIVPAYDVSWNVGGKTSKVEGVTVPVSSIKNIAKAWQDFLAKPESKLLFTAEASGKTAEEIASKTKMYSSYGFEPTSSGLLVADNRAGQLSAKGKIKPLDKESALEIGKSIAEKGYVPEKYVRVSLDLVKNNGYSMGEVSINLPKSEAINLAEDDAALFAKYANDKADFTANVTSLERLKYIPLRERATHLYNDHNLHLSIDRKKPKGLKVPGYEVSWASNGLLFRNANDKATSIDGLKRLTKAWETFVSNPNARVVFTATISGTSAEEIATKLRQYQRFGFRLADKGGYLIGDNRLGQLINPTAPRLSKEDAFAVATSLLKKRGIPKKYQTTSFDEVNGFSLSPDSPLTSANAAPSPQTTIDSAVDFSNLDSNGLKAKAAEYGVSVEGINFRSKPQRDALRKQLEEAAAKQQEPIITKTPREMAAEYLAGKTKSINVETIDQLKSNPKFKDDDSLVLLPSDAVQLPNALKLIADQRKQLEKIGYRPYVERKLKTTLEEIIALNPELQGLNVDEYMEAVGVPVGKREDLKAVIAAMDRINETKAARLSDSGDRSNYVPTNMLLEEGITEEQLNGLYNKYDNGLSLSTEGASAGIHTGNPYPTDFRVTISPPDTYIERLEDGNGYKPSAQSNPHNSTTDLLNVANEEPPSLCNL